MDNHVRERSPPKASRPRSARQKATVPSPRTTPSSQANRFDMLANVSRLRYRLTTMLAAVSGERSPDLSCGTEASVPVHPVSEILWISGSAPACIKLRLAQLIQQEKSKPLHNG